MLIFPAGLLQGCLLNEYEKLSDATYIDSYPLSSSPEAEAQALARRMFLSLPITSLSIHKPRTRLTFFPSQQNDETKVLEYSHGLEGKKCQLQTLFHLPHEIHISKCRKMTRHLLFEWKNQPAGRTKSLQHWDTGHGGWREGVPRAPGCNPDPDTYLDSPLFTQPVHRSCRQQVGRSSVEHFPVMCWETLNSQLS